MVNIIRVIRVHYIRVIRVHNIRVIRVHNIRVIRVHKTVNISMPINKSGIRYELYDTPKKDESSGTYTQQQLEEYLQRHWAIHPSDARRFMTAFVDALSQLLANGYRIDTLLGSFYPKLKLDAPFTATDKVTANDVAFDGIGFLADKAFTEKVRNSIGGLRRERGHKSNPLGSPADIRRKVTKLARDNGGIFDMRDFRLAFGVSDYMARKHLKMLSEGPSPFLCCKRMGSSLTYSLKVETPKENP